jgi:hypothetical protein
VHADELRVSGLKAAICMRAIAMWTKESWEARTGVAMGSMQLMCGMTADVLSQAVVHAVAWVVRCLVRNVHGAGAEQSRLLDLSAWGEDVGRVSAGTPESALAALLQWQEMETAPSRMGSSLPPAADDGQCLGAWMSAAHEAAKLLLLLAWAGGSEDELGLEGDRCSTGRETPLTAHQHPGHMERPDTRPSSWLYRHRQT